MAPVRQVRGYPSRVVEPNDQETVKDAASPTGASASFTVADLRGHQIHLVTVELRDPPTGCTLLRSNSRSSATNAPPAGTGWSDLRLGGRLTKPSTGASGPTPRGSRADAGTPHINCGVPAGVPEDQPPAVALAKASICARSTRAPTIIAPAWSGLSGWLLNAALSNAATIRAASASRSVPSDESWRSSSWYCASFGELLIIAAVETRRLARPNWPTGALSCL